MAGVQGVLLARAMTRSSRFRRPDKRNRCVWLNRRNSALSPSNIIALFGCTNSGTANVPVIYRSSPGKPVTDFGYGPGTGLRLR